MPDDAVEIIDIGGYQFGTGLLVPHTTKTRFQDFSTKFETLSYTKLREFAKDNDTKGRTRFDKSYIKNQRSHGSCNGFAGASALTRARVRRGLPRVDLSGAYLYSLINGGRDGGSMLDDGMTAIVSQGCATEETVKWNQIYPRQYDKAKADKEAAEYKAFECYAVRTELELFTALALGFDCVVAVHADNAFMKLDSRGVAQGGRGPGNHAVGGDGYWCDDKGELIADGVNSWDLIYGDNGRMGLTWQQHFRHTIQYHAFYAIRSTIDSAKDLPPIVRLTS